MTVNNVMVMFDSNEILKDVSFTLNRNDKVGLVGTNGSGKSTLLKTLCGELTPTSGKINFQGESIGYLKQEINYKYNGFTILDYIKSELGILNLEKRINEIEQNLNDENMDEYTKLIESFIELDGYNFEDNLKVILSGLNLKESLYTKIESLSGGEKIKVLLAIVLLKNSDILLLDEPTNNLDIEAVEWLEKYLKSSNKKMIIVSHDETFLNSIANRILELKNGIISEYNMKYSNYLEEKEREYSSEYISYNKAVEEKEKLKKQIQKAKEWSNKGNNKKANSDNDKLANNYAKERTNSSNVSKLSRTLNSLDIPNFDQKEPINFFFSFDNSKGNKDIIMEELVCGYSKFHTPKIDLTVNYGQRLQILGSNGSGKTTLIKTILGEIPPISGKVVIGSSAKLGYISQETLSENNKGTLFEYIMDGIECSNMSLIFTLLDKFNISYEDKDKKYRDLSPGERTRVNLVKIALNGINVIVLDEVTNHLDKDALDLIYELIGSYEGTIISISHNRKYNQILNPDLVLDISNGITKYSSLNKNMHL